MGYGRAFCPGHVTAFFEICEAEEPLRRGSRGAGFCISKGVRTEVETRDSEEQDITFIMNGEPAEAETTELVVRRMLGSRKLSVDVSSSVELPVSQGFGMSGAGALGTALALDRALELHLPRDELLGMAHTAEVEAMTGLGDVYPQGLGGMEVRVRPGAPPAGEVRRKGSSRTIFLCVLGGELRTKDVLRNPMKRKKISEVGRRCVDEYLRKPSWPELCRLSRLFAETTGLISPEVGDAIDAVEAAGGTAGMAMLGNSVFASGRGERLKDALGGMGDIYHCNIENGGARLIPRA